MALNLVSFHPGTSLKKQTDIHIQSLQTRISYVKQHNIMASELRAAAEFQKKSATIK